MKPRIRRSRFHGWYWCSYPGMPGGIGYTFADAYADFLSNPYCHYYNRYTLKELKEWTAMPSSSAATVHALVAALERK